MRYLLIVLLLFIGCDDDPVSPIHGCFDSQACNYNPSASIDNNSCLYLDECGECGGDNSTCTDECDVVNGDGSTCEGCDGISNSGLVNDECGICNGPGLDCGGGCNQNIELWGICFNIEATTAIDLCCSQLNGDIPEEIGLLTNLTHIWLSDNNLTSIPESIENLVNLELLTLPWNNLSSIPESICNLNNLTYDLEVFGNNLCNEYHYDCISDWGFNGINAGNDVQDQSNCCPGTNNAGELDPNWTTCP